MSYSLNNIPLSNYGIEAGQASGSNLAVKGMFDMPERGGECYRSWGDEGIEAFTDADDIYFKGRDLSFHGFILGTRAEILARLDSLKSDISAYTNLVQLSTPYGDFSVKVEKIDSDVMEGGTGVVIHFREPEVDITGGVIPGVGESNYEIDGIPFKAFGMYVSKVSGWGSTPEQQQEYFTSYGKEGYQITGRDISEVFVNVFLLADSMNELTTKIRALWALFSSPGLREVKLKDWTIDALIKDGFKVDKIYANGGNVTATINMKMIAVDKPIVLYLTEDTGSFHLQTEEGTPLNFG